MAAASITISDGIQKPNHDLFDVFFNSDHLITTTVTSDASVVTDWISSVSSTESPLLVGLDIEWRPNFGRQYDNPVATLQLCTVSPTSTSSSTTTTTSNTQSLPSSSCLIFQILHCPPPLPQSLSDFLRKENITFFGVGIRNDVEQLLVDYELNVKNVVDLGELAVQKLSGAKKGLGLKDLAKMVMQIEVQKPKSVALSRWDSEWLSYQQIQYACIDAFLSFEIGSKLMALPSLTSGK